MAFPGGKLPGRLGILTLKFGLLPFDPLQLGPGKIPDGIHVDLEGRRDTDPTRRWINPQIDVLNVLFLYLDYYISQPQLFHIYSPAPTET
jgi:hypothetical protein